MRICNHLSSITFCIRFLCTHMNVDIQYNTVLGKIIATFPSITNLVMACNQLFDIDLCTRVLLNVHGTIKLDRQICMRIADNRVMCIMVSFTAIAVFLSFSFFFVLVDENQIVQTNLLQSVIPIRLYHLSFAP